MIGAVGAHSKRWVALVAAVAIVAHAFGMGLLGPRMAESAAAARAIAAELATSPAAEDCPFHAAAAADLAHGAASGDEHAGEKHSGADPAEHQEKHPPSCAACPLGQIGMALAPPPIVPPATAFLGIGSAALSVSALLVAAWPHRAPPARAPPVAATA